MNDEKIEIIYKNSELERFRQDILAGNLCDIFLPVSFIQADGYVGAVYDMHDYEYYPDIRSFRASTLIGIVTSLIEKSTQANRRYFFQGLYLAILGICDFYRNGYFMRFTGCKKCNNT